MADNTCIVCGEPIDDDRTMCEDDRTEEIYESWAPYGYTADR